MCTAIVRRGNTWRVHVYLGADARTGKQRYLTRTVRGTKRDAEKVRADLVAQAVHGKFGETAAGTVADVTERWLEHLEPDISPATASAYRVYLRNRIVPRIGGRRSIGCDRQTSTGFTPRSGSISAPPAC